MCTHIHVVGDGTSIELPNAFHVATKKLAFDPGISAWRCFSNCGSNFWDVMNSLRKRTWGWITIVPVDGEEEVIILHPYRGVLAAMENGKCCIYTIENAGWVDTPTTEKNWGQRLCLKRHVHDKRFVPPAKRVITTPQPQAMPTDAEAALKRTLPLSEEEKAGFARALARSLKDKRRIVPEFPRPPGRKRVVYPPGPMAPAEEDLENLIRLAAIRPVYQAEYLIADPSLENWLVVVWEGNPYNRNNEFHPLIMDILKARVKYVHILGRTEQEVRAQLYPEQHTSAGSSTDVASGSPHPNGASQSASSGAA